MGLRTPPDGCDPLSTLYAIPVVLGLLSTFPARTAVSKALAKNAELAICINASELYSSLNRYDVDAVLVEVGPDVVTTIATIRRRFPRTPIIALAQLTVSQMHCLLEIGHAGASNVIVMGHDDFETVLLRSIGVPASVESVLRTELMCAIPSVAREPITTFIANLRRGWSVTGLAAAVGMSARSLGRQFQNANLPAPIRVLAGIRVAAAAYLLEQSDAKVNAVARRIGMRSVLTLRRQFKEVAGYSPTEARHSGAFQDVIRRIMADWSSHSKAVPMPTQ